MLESGDLAPDAAVPKKDLTTLLLLGIDKEGKMEKVPSNINDQQCDFLTLVLLDAARGTYDLLQLNRDTMTPVDVLGLGGVVIESVPMQLALSHTYGDAMEESCENSVRAVERLLGGEIEIDHYLAINMTGLAGLVDALGGVTVTIQDDFSNVDPTLIQGETMLLDGRQCLTYLRGRRGVADNTNLTRAERQKAFLQKLLPAMKNKGELAMQALAEVSSYMLTDLSSGGLEKLLEKWENSSLQEIHTPPGKAVLGEEYIEFYVDTAGLNALVRQLFFVQEEERTAQ